jgi:hypothetical protein
MHILTYHQCPMQLLKPFTFLPSARNFSITAAKSLEGRIVNFFFLLHIFETKRSKLINL